MTQPVLKVQLHEEMEPILIFQEVGLSPQESIIEFFKFMVKDLGKIKIINGAIVIEWFGDYPPVQTLNTRADKYPGLALNPNKQRIFLN
jgi:hypothetical protein